MSDAAAGVHTDPDVFEEGFVYGLASVDLYRILHDFALDPGSPGFKAPPNHIAHSRMLARPDDRSVVAPNVDTPYSYAWLDLRAEPVVLTLPSVPDDRYLSAQLVDLSTYIIGYVSPRTSGHEGGSFLVAGPGWIGEPPAGVTGVFRSPTDLCLVLVRTQLLDGGDLPNVAALQDACEVEPLSRHKRAEPPPPAPALEPIAPVDVRADPDPRFFDVLAWMLQHMPPLEEDRGVRARLAAAGVRPGEPFTPPADADAVLAGMRAGLGDVLARSRTVRSSGELFGSREHFGGDHLTRACGAFLGILGNAEEEYLGVGYQADADGAPFDGRRRYAITFAPGGLPPVDAFWSITVYTADKLLYANRLDRYVIGSRALEGLVREPDGALTIEVRHDPPEPGREPNWLPCPEGPFGLTFRTYLPGAAIRSGAWTAPPVRVVGRG